MTSICLRIYSEHINLVSSFPYFTNDRNKLIYFMLCCTYLLNHLVAIECLFYNLQDKIKNTFDLQTASQRYIDIKEKQQIEYFCKGYKHQSINSSARDCVVCVYCSFPENGFVNSSEVHLSLILMFVGFYH